MKQTLIFSDTHFTSQVDRPRLDYIAKLITQADQVIINGDFFDGYLVTFDTFLTSGWSALFPLLQKKTTYLYGNHDKASMSDARVQAFSSAQDYKLEFALGQTQVVVMHGDALSPSLDGMLPWAMGLLGSLYPGWLLIESNLANALPPVKWVLDGKRQLKNVRIARYAKTLPNEQVLIAGHSHIPYSSARYYNPGRFSTHFARYVLLGEDGSISVHEDKL